MQRHCKRYKKTLIALAMAVLTIALAAVPSFAITPPINGETGVLTEGYYGRPTLANAQKYRDVATMQYALGSFNNGQLLAIVIASGVTSLYCNYGASYGAYLDLSEGAFTYVPVSGNYCMQYRITDFGFQNQNRTTVNSSTFTAVNVLAYRNINGDFVLNDLFTYGTDGGGIDTPYQKWLSFYDKVYNYDSNIADAEAQGRADGYEDGLTAGYEIGEEAGYNSGYADGQEYGEEIGFGEGYQEGYEGGVYAGYADGYETGFAEGNANAEQRYQQGVIAGQQAGYSQGYTEGQTYGYETGYREGQEYTYPIAYQEGYDDGYEEGVASGEGGDTIITENLDIGSIISAIPQGAKNIINGALGFEIFGINVAGTLTAILVVAIIAFVIKWLMTR